MIFKNYDFKAVTLKPALYNPVPTPTPSAPLASDDCIKFPASTCPCCPS
ncbi:MAG: hypothetical protein IJ877_07365 [Candidatus Gastranaerophilales bacterium]|nr:hypothetical protein [Candidatus Gastranaerophilales bacterium]